MDWSFKPKQNKIYDESSDCLTVSLATFQVPYREVFRLHTVEHLTILEFVVAGQLVNDDGYVSWFASLLVGSRNASERVNKKSGSMCYCLPLLHQVRSNDGCCFYSYPQQLHETPWTWSNSSGVCCENLEMRAMR